MNTDKRITGHMAALLSILIWGTTFIFTKLLLVSFAPIELMFYRFGIGLAALTMIYPHRMKKTGVKQELMFAGAGLCGVTLYFLFENIALTYTQASNVGVIVSIAPFFTALLSRGFLKDEKLSVNFFMGFVVAISGIILINFNGNKVLNLNPLGDLLAMLAAAVWSIYSILTRKISSFGHNTIQTTRRVFLYGLLFMIPVISIFPFSLGIERFSKPENVFSILFLGLVASALCFVTWNIAVEKLGAVKTSIYIYLIPAITVITSVSVLKERITWIAACGTILTISGLFISEKKAWSNHKHCNEKRMDG